MSQLTLYTTVRDLARSLAIYPPGRVYETDDSFRSGGVWEPAAVIAFARATIAGRHFPDEGTSGTFRVYWDDYYPLDPTRLPSWALAYAEHRRVLFDQLKPTNFTASNGALVTIEVGDLGSQNLGTREQLYARLRITITRTER